MDQSIAMARSEKSMGSSDQVMICQDESNFPNQLESIENFIFGHYLWPLYGNKT